MRADLDPGREAALDLACDSAAKMADPYGSELIALACERPHLTRDDLLRLSLLARDLEALGLRASRWCRLQGAPDIDHRALAAALPAVADYLRPAPPEPDPATPGPINAP